MAVPEVSTHPRLLVFDLDGTLIDSRRDLCNSVNATLTFLGRHPLPDDVIASYIGDGASMLVRRALGDPQGDAHDQELLSDALDFFLNFYRAHKLDHTRLYPGVLEALAQIRSGRPDLPMAVLTNKPVVPSREICDHLGLTPFFFQNYGGNSFHTKKPDPIGLLTLVREASVISNSDIPPSNTIMIGDSDVDVLTAQNCGARSVACTFGLAPHTLANVQPDYIAHAPSDWPELLLAQPDVY